MMRGPDFSKDIPAGVVRTIMRKADLDESGYLEYPEFIAMVSQNLSNPCKDTGNYFSPFVKHIFEESLIIDDMYVDLSLTFRSTGRTCRVYSDTSCNDTFIL